MRKLFLILFFILINNCSGYKPIFSDNNLNYNLGTITSKNQNILSRKFITKLKRYYKKDSDNKIIETINLVLETESQEKVISKDVKGDPILYEIKLLVNVEYIKNAKSKTKKYSEVFTYQNQSNKFELNQYKTNILNNLIERIFGQIILDLALI